MWEILIFKCILLLKIQVNSKKPGFGRKNLFKKLIHTLQNNVHMLSFPILQWVHTWANTSIHYIQMLILQLQWISIKKCVFFSNFVRFVVWRPSPRELSQTERPVREESRKV
jgi:hypothetical protein